MDWYVEAPQPGYHLRFDHAKAALHGITAAHVVSVVQTALDGTSVGLLHLPHEKEDVSVVVQLPRAERSHLAALLALHVRSPQGVLVPLAGLVQVSNTTEPPFI